MQANACEFESVRTDNNNTLAKYNNERPTPFFRKLNNPVRRKCSTPLQRKVRDDQSLSQAVSQTELPPGLDAAAGDVITELNPIELSSWVP